MAVFSNVDIENINCKRYFLFKFSDVVNNSFHTFEEKRVESLQQFCNLIIDTYEEYHTSYEGDKLKKSYMALLRAFKFQMECHPFKNIDICKKDFAYLRGIIEPDKDGFDRILGNIYSCVITLQKKLYNMNFVESYFVCLDQIKDFQETDFLIEAFISDMLDKGVSLAFLNECSKEMKEAYFKDQDINKALQILETLDKKIEKFKVFIKFDVHGSSEQVEKAIGLIQKDFDVINIPDFAYDSIWKNEPKYIANKEIEAMDSTGAIYKAQKEFNSIIGFFDMWQGTKMAIKDDPKYVRVSDGNPLPVDVSKINNVKMLGYIDDSHRKQMERFLELKDLLENEEIEILERILYTLNTARSFSIQNRFLNFWSSLEYIVHSFPRNSIIEKVREIVPKVLGLFYIKNKMNVFWRSLAHYMRKRDDLEKFGEIILFMNECKNEEDYSTKKVIEIFLDASRTQKIVEELEGQIVLKREFMELHMLINKPEKLKKIIKRYTDSIEHDLDYIYRLRNRMIHSSKQSDEYLEFVSMRIYHYVNSLMSTILYYKKKNPEFSIIDILNSINITYSEYYKKLEIYEKNRASDCKTLEAGYQLVRPSYLFME